MDAEQIVRALAARNPALYETGECGVCEAGLRLVPGQPGQTEMTHLDDCPWVLAREWVAANPA